MMVYIAALQTPPGKPKSTDLSVKEKNKELNWKHLRWSMQMRSIRIPAEPKWTLQRRCGKASSAPSQQVRIGMMKFNIAKAGHERDIRNEREIPMAGLV